MRVDRKSKRTAAHKMREGVRLTSCARHRSQWSFAARWQGWQSTISCCTRSRGSSVSENPLIRFLVSPVSSSVAGLVQSPSFHLRVTRSLCLAVCTSARGRGVPGRAGRARRGLTGRKGSLDGERSRGRIEVGVVELNERAYAACGLRWRLTRRLRRGEREARPAANGGEGGKKKKIAPLGPMLFSPGVSSRPRLLSFFRVLSSVQEKTPVRALPAHHAFAQRLTSSPPTGCSSSSLSPFHSSFSLDR